MYWVIFLTYEIPSRWCSAFIAMRCVIRALITSNRLKSLSTLVEYLWTYRFWAFALTFQRWLKMINFIFISFQEQEIHQHRVQREVLVRIQRHRDNSYISNCRRVRRPPIWVAIYRQIHRPNKRYVWMTFDNVISLLYKFNSNAANLKRKDPCTLHMLIRNVDSSQVENISCEKDTHTHTYTCIFLSFLHFSSSFKRLIVSCSSSSITAVHSMWFYLLFKSRWEWQTMAKIKKRNKTKK